MSFEKHNPGADRVLLTGRQQQRTRLAPRASGVPGVVLEPSARRETARARTGRPRWYRKADQARIGPGSQKHNPDMYTGEESNTGIVPTKLPNKGRGNTAGGGGGGKARDQGEHHGT